MSYNETGLLAGLRTALIILLVAGGSVAVLLTVGGFFGDKWWVFDYVANYRWQLFWGFHPLNWLLAWMPVRPSPRLD